MRPDRVILGPRQSSTPVPTLQQQQRRENWSSGGDEDYLMEEPKPEPKVRSATFAFGFFLLAVVAVGMFFSIRKRGAAATPTSFYGGGYQGYQGYQGY
jgi:hypothetical protein